MNIVVIGAGAIGSLFGALLSKNNNVTLVGRKDHINKIKKQGLLIKDNTKLNVKIDAEKSVKNIKKHPDILILSVKSYDTINAINQAKSIIDKDTIVMSLQNGLDNIEKIEKVVDRKQIVSCITTHGAIFTEPGIITHTGFGRTIVGGFDKDKLGKFRDLAKNLTESGIKTDVCKDFEKEIWIKAIINSSINTLTAIFDCKNGYLLKNPILENIVEKICKESTDVANSKNLSLSYENMIKRTKQVIFHTSNNYSSMLQSIKKNKKTEIESINGIIVREGLKNKIKTPLNNLLIRSIKSNSLDYNHCLCST